MIFHLAERPALWRIEGVPLKFLMKAILFFIPLFLFAAGKRRRRALALILAIQFCISNPAWAGSRACRHARELLSKSGVARDAKEDLLGRVKVSPPAGSFPADMDKVTWWGEFQPFEFWERPKFEAVWIDPGGTEKARQKFYPGQCRLAKTAVRGEDQPRGEFQSGMWNVLVTCDDYLVDKKSFAVLPAGGPPKTGPDSKVSSKEGAMIWAKDQVR